MTDSLIDCLIVYR